MQKRPGLSAASGQRMGSKYYTRRQKMRMRKRRMRFIRFLICAALLIMLICGAVIGVRLAMDILPSKDTFAEGVTINGVALSGYSPEEAEDMLMERYSTTLTSTITLVYGEKSWQFAPEDINARVDAHEQVTAAWAYGREGSLFERQAEIRSLRKTPVDLSVTLTYDRESLALLVDEIKKEIDCAPVSATMQIVEVEQFAYTDSATGCVLDADALVKELEQAIRDGISGTIEIKPAIVQPEVSRAELEASTVLLGECFTSLDGSSSTRASNVNLALSYFNFFAVAPNEKVSFNSVVGKRTEKNGFKKAPEYAGTTIIEGVGGGTCQASTTVYGAVIRAGLKVIERGNHKMTVGYVPASQDAAVSDSDKDLKFQNTTDSTLYMFAYIERSTNRAVCKIYGKPIDDTVYIEIESIVLQSDIVGTRIHYVDDVDGTRVWYKDETPVLLSKGKAGMRSEAYRVYLSVATNEEVSREKLSSDYYQPGDDTYLRGVHER